MNKTASDSISIISPFQFITDKLEEIEMACKGGANWIQLRVKDKSHNECLSLAVAANTICKRFDAKLIINDHVLIAKEVEAHGVHLGKSDMSPLEARNILGNDFIIGGTANSFDDILKLKEDRVDYIGLGPFRFTTTKKDLSPVLGLNGYKQILQQMDASKIKIPVIAIGGIVEEDLDSLFATGFYGVAVSSAISSRADKAFAVKSFLQTIKRIRYV